MLIKRMHFWLSLVKSTKLRKLLIKEYPGIKYSTWSNGKDILILTANGWMYSSWAMPGRQLWTLKQTCLGRQGPEGGVVLGLHPDYDDLY
jgi:hypothetical protein